MKEDTPLYNIEDNNADNADQPLYRIGADEENLPYAYGVEDPDNEKAEDADSKKSSNSIALLLKIMFSPVTGWKSLKRAKLKPERVAGSLFYPLCALAAASCFIDLVYEANNSISGLLVDALIVFISYFFSYFILPVVGRPFLCTEVNESLQTNFGKDTVMVLLSTLAIFKILLNVVPGLEPVIVFMPLWTIYLTHRVVPMLRAPKDKWAMSTVLLSILIVGLPTFFDWLLDMILK